MDNLTFINSYFAYLMPLSMLLLLFAFMLYITNKERFGKLSPIAPSQAILSIKAITLTLSSLFIILALMEPVFVTTARHSQKREEKNITFLIDTSTSMGVEDEDHVTRLFLAKKLSLDILKEQKYKDNKFALYTFAEDTMQISPLTEDYLFVALQLEQITLLNTGTSGTNIVQALTRIYNSLPHTTQNVLVFTDGGDALTNRDIKNLKKLAQKKNIHIKFIALGSTQGGAIPFILKEGISIRSSVNLQSLNQMATILNGNVYTEKNIDSLKLAKIEDKQPIDESSTTYYKIPLFLALIFLGFHIFSKQTSLKRIFPLLCLSFISASPYIIEQNNLMDTKQFDKALENNMKAQKADLSSLNRFKLIYNESLIKQKLGKSKEAYFTLYTLPDLTQINPYLAEKTDQQKKRLSQMSQEDMTEYQRELLPLLNAQVSAIENSSFDKTILIMGQKMLTSFFKQQLIDFENQCQKKPWDDAIPALLLGLEKLKWLETNQIKPTEIELKSILKDFLMSFIALGKKAHSKDEQQQKLESLLSTQESLDAPFYQNREQRRPLKGPAKW